ncbi:MAG: CDP-alcohol phosphatidyltransferase family protein [Methyloligellaceae bacterium]
MTHLQRKWIGASIHLLTASGALCGLFALHFAVRHDWQAVFALLGLALAIDGIDGWLARRSTLAVVLPRFSGQSLDLVVDYLNYVVVPAFVVFESGRLNAGQAELGASLIVLSSLYHFADQSSKTRDGYFVGFPALWNIVVFYFFVIPVPAAWAFFLILLFCGLTFVPIKWAHPFRTTTQKVPALIVMVAWAIASLYAIIDDLPAALGIQIIFVIAALGFIGMGIRRTMSKEPSPDRQ